MKAILIDTDVLMDLLIDRKPFSEHSAEVLRLCETQKTNGYVTPVIISNLYYLLRKIASHQKVLTHLKKLLEVIDVVKIDKKSVLLAIDSEFKDFEDALQNFAAQEHPKIQAIVTRNIKDYKHSNLAVFTPLEFCKSFS
ncbi:MAG: PIN domain-containing protein [Bacteroidetes bacterium]|nr:PIN domain-containing protein [Bacteroidota bacterium]